MSEVFEWVTWLLGIVFPIVLIACSAKLVVVRTEIRLRSARKAKTRFATWLTKSRLHRQRHETAVSIFRDAARDRNRQSPTGLMRALVAGLSGIVVIWIRGTAMPGKYLMGDHHEQIRRNISFLADKERQYLRGLAKDLASLKDSLTTGVDWKRFFGENRSLLFLGVAVMITSTAVASSVDWWPESALWLSAAVAIPLLGVVFVLQNERAISYSWGCVFVLIVALTTLEFSPLHETVFEQGIDAQKVTTMFIGVGIVLTLSQLFDRRGIGTHVSSFERCVIEESYRLTLWDGLRTAILNRFQTAPSSHARVNPVWASGKRIELVWLFFVLVLYGGSVGHFLIPIVESANWDLGPRTGEGIRPILPIVTATACVLALPIVSLARATRTRFLALVVVVLTALFVACATRAAASEVNGQPEPEGEDNPVRPPLSEDALRIFCPNVYFDFGSAELTANAVEVLGLISWVLRENEGLDLTIVGHTDDIGTERFNVDLGKLRANAVQDFLVKSGFVRWIGAESLGEGEPQNPRQTREGRAQNRRVEFKIAGEGVCGR